MFYCPFCQKQTIKVFYRPSFKKRISIRGSGQSGSKGVTTNPEITMLSTSCSNCGKTEKEIAPLL